VTRPTVWLRAVPTPSEVLPSGFALRPMLHSCALLNRGTAPAERVYDDDDVAAIMDVHPAATGHVWVIPKRHWQDLWHVDRQAAEETMAQQYSRWHDSAGAWPGWDQPCPYDRESGVADGLALPPCTWCPRPRATAGRAVLAGDGRTPYTLDVVRRALS
jgi:HIT domain